MAGISIDLHIRCQSVLLRCDQFKDHASLQTVFVRTELAIYRDLLPQTDNPNQRVSQTILFLLDKKLSDGRPVFPIFLETLRDLHNPDDSLFGTLEGLCSDVKSELEKVEIIDIPFVIVAMTRDEATALFEETIFKRPDVASSEQLAFQSLKKTLQDGDSTAWINHYDEDRNNWNPHLCQDHTIRTMIVEASDRLNEDVYAQNNLSLIRPQFLSKEFLTDDDKKRIDTWEQLSKLGCVIIVDAISLFHPLIYRKLLQSEMSSNRQAAMAMLILSPEAHQTNELIEQEIKMRLQRAFARFDQYDDTFCKLDVRQWRDLRRWLKTVLPESIKKIELTPNVTLLSQMRGKIHKAHGMSKAISGQLE